MLKLNLAVVVLALPAIIVYLFGGYMPIMDKYPAVVWGICALFLVPMGSSLIAGYYITLKMVNDEEGYIFGPFFKEFKANFKRGCVLGALLLVAVYAMWIDFQMMRIYPESKTMFLIVFILGVVLIVTHFLYAFPLMARYENGVVNTLRNSHSIAVRYFPRTFFTVVLLAVEVVFFIFNKTTIFLGILIGPACLLLTVSANARPIFIKIEDENKAPEEKDQKKLN